MKRRELSAAIARVIAADGSGFVELVRVSGLDPKKDFRRTNLSGLNLSNQDLTGFDFSMTDLTGCNFAGALVSGAKLSNAKISPGALERASDWRPRGRYAGNWVEEYEANILPRTTRVLGHESQDARATLFSSLYSYRRSSDGINRRQRLFSLVDTLHPSIMVRAVRALLGLPANLPIASSSEFDDPHGLEMEMSQRYFDDAHSVLRTALEHAPTYITALCVFTTMRSLYPRENGQIPRWLANWIRTGVDPRGTTHRGKEDRLFYLRSNDAVLWEKRLIWRHDSHRDPIDPIELSSLVRHAVGVEDVIRQTRRLALRSKGLPPEVVSAFRARLHEVDQKSVLVKHERYGSLFARLFEVGLLGSTLSPTDDECATLTTMLLGASEAVVHKETGDRHRYQLGILRALRAHASGSLAIRELELRVARILKLSESELGEPHTDGRRTRFEYNMAWARTHLKWAGAVVNPSRGIWTITSKGRKMNGVQLAAEIRAAKARQAAERDALWTAMGRSLLGD